MNNRNYIEEYYNKILSGEIKVSKAVEVVYKREIELMNNEDSIYYFDFEASLKPIDFIENYCKHSKGAYAGKPVKLELFQKAKIQLAFGFKHKDSGLRRFREVGTFEGRKNGKTTETAGVGWYMAMGDGEGGADVAFLANKLDQAKLAYNECINMRLQSKVIRELTKKRQSDIYYPRKFSKLYPVSSETKSGDGYNFHFFCLDEIHEARSRALYDLAKQSQSAREQPMAWIISTNGFVRENFFDEQYKMYKDIALGHIKDDTILPIIYELDSIEEYDDESCWQKANPGLGTIKKIETLQNYIKQAKNSPTFKNTVLAKDFNIPATSSSAWLSYENIVNEQVVKMEYLKHSYAIGGCDLSSLLDLTCSTLLINKPNDKNTYVLQMYFIPQSKIDKLKESAKDKNVLEAPYELWAEQGWLTICAGSQINYSDVTAWFVKMQDEHDIRMWACGYDRALSGYWVPEMEAQGFDMDVIAQGTYTWSQPMKEMEAGFEENTIIYQNNPILRWCLANTAVKRTNEDSLPQMRPIKISTSGRIDGTVSLLNAWTCRNKHIDEYMTYIR